VHEQRGRGAGPAGDARTAASATAQTSRVLRASGVGGEIRARRHLAITEQQSIGGSATSLPGRRPARNQTLLVPELLDRDGSHSLPPYERRAIPRHPILGERGGEPERVIAQETAHATGLVETMRQRAGPCACAILR
jgi:hypothetical protein